MESNKPVITDEYKLRIRYNEVDQMGYAYHSNYVIYCHQARTELMRKIGIHDKALEDAGLILPVIEMHLNYKKPAFYDDELRIVTTIKKIPEVKISFDFTFFNANDEKIGTAYTTLAIVDNKTRKPIRAPKFIKEAFEKNRV